MILSKDDRYRLHQSCKTNMVYKKNLKQILIANFMTFEVLKKPGMLDQDNDPN